VIERRELSRWATCKGVNRRDMDILRLERLAELTDPASLGAVSVREEPLSTPGFSGATHRRLVAVLPSGETRRFVLKLCDPTREWTATRTGDSIGREWSLLAERALDTVWEAFVSPSSRTRSRVADRAC
jgi:hypothetical protein